MSSPLVYAYKESSDVADSVADFIIKLQNEALTSAKYFNVAVSGGSLVKVLRTGLLKRNDEVKWSNWRIFFADERIVPLDHEDSNFGLLKKELLDHLDTSKSTRFPTVVALDDTIPFDASHELFAQAYQRSLVQNLGESPKLDLILLGCGPDGHTCSLFPGHKLLDEHKKLVASLDDSPKPPPKRITLTFPVLKLADHIAFVAEGAGKAPVLKEIFETPEKGLPCALVNQSAKNPTKWFVNTPAIEGVDVKNSA